MRSFELRGDSRQGAGRRGELAAAVAEEGMIEEGVSMCRSRLETSQRILTSAIVNEGV